MGFWPLKDGIFLKKVDFVRALRKKWACHKSKNEGMWYSYDELYCCNQQINLIQREILF